MLPEVGTPIRPVFCNTIVAQRLLRMQMANMSHIGKILAQFLPHGTDDPSFAMEMGATVGRELRYRRYLKGGLVVARVIPSKDDVVPVHNWVSSKMRFRMGTPRVWDLDTFTRGSKAPPVEWASNRLALDPSTVCEVSSKVRTIGVRDVDGAASPPPYGEFLSEITSRKYAIRRDLVSFRNSEPAEGNRTLMVGIHTRQSLNSHRYST